MRDDGNKANRLVEQIWEVLDSLSAADMRGVVVSEIDGHVVLGGKLSSSQEHALALKAVWTVNGVKNVVTEIQLRDRT